MTHPIERITLRDVAKAAAVSPMTVSRVIRGFHNVTPATRDRVAIAVESLGYHPNPALSALASYRRGSSSKPSVNTIAFLDNSQTMESSEILRGAIEGAVNIGYSIERYHLTDDPKVQQRLQRILFHRGIRGLLFGPTSNIRILHQWNWSNFAGVQLGGQFHSAQMNGVAIDHFQSVFIASKALLSEGYSRIALAVDPKEPTNTQWFGGYCAGLKDSGQPPLFADSAWGSPKLGKWLQQNKVDAMLTVDSGFSDPGREPWRIARNKKLAVILLIDSGAPGMAAMRVDCRIIGSEGIRILHHYLFKSEYGLPAASYLLTLPSVLIRRDVKGEIIHSQPFGLQKDHASMGSPLRRNPFSRRED